MMKNLQLLFWLLLSTIYFGQNSTSDFGIGLLVCNTEFPIVFYKKKSDKIPWDTLKFEPRENGTTKFVSKLNLKPYSISEGDSKEEAKKHEEEIGFSFSPKLTFRMLKNEKNFLLVRINEKTNEKRYLKKEKDAVYYKNSVEAEKNNCTNCEGSNFNPKRYIYNSWDEYLRKVEYVEKKDAVIYDEPDGEIIFENKTNDRLGFKVLEVNGEWIRVKKSERNSTNPFEKEGWMKWIENGKKVIGIISVVLI